MALTDLDLVNQASAIIGDDALQDLEADTVGGQPAALLYETELDFALGLYPWSFGRRLFQLSRDDLAVILSGYAYAYDLPPERLEFPDYITDSATDPDRRFHGFAVFGSKVHSDATALFAMCRIRPNPIDMSSGFRAAFVQALASRFALARADDKNLSADLRTIAYGTPSEGNRGGMMGTAMGTDSFGTPVRAADWASNNPLIAARWS